MDNVSPNQLRKCIFMEYEDFKALISELTNGLLEVEYDNGIRYNDTDKAEKTGDYWFEDITVTLSRHFNTAVTSVHGDGCEFLGIWICYA